MRYSNIFNKIKIDKVNKINFYTSKDWKKYAIHAIDPVVHKFNLFNQRYKIFFSKNKKNENFFELHFEKIQVYIFLSKDNPNLKFEFINNKYKKILNFNDPLNSFSKSLKAFQTCVKLDNYYSTFENQKYIIKILESMSRLYEQ